MNRPSTIERAIELAQSGPCASVGEIRDQLRRERHEAVDSHLSGAMIRRQLNALLTGKRSGQASPVST